MNYRSPSFIVATILASIVLLCVGFMGGRIFERIRLRHLDNWRNNYERNFLGDRDFLLRPGRPPLPPGLNAHAVLGKILTIDKDNFTIQGPHGIEQSIIVSDNTVIRQDGDQASLNTLKVGQNIVVFGQPNDKGQVAADLIRIINPNENPLP